jgi:hypothetical protein
VNVLVGASLHLTSRKIIGVHTGVVLFIAVMTFSWWQASVRTMPSGPPDLYYSPSMAAEAIASPGRLTLGQYRIYRQQMTFPDTDLAGRDQPRLVRVRRWERDTLCVNLDTMEGFEDVVGFNAARPSEGLLALQKGLDQLEAGREPEILALYNVEYLLSSRNEQPLSAGAGVEVFVDKRSNLRITRLLRAWPRAYWVAAAIRARDEAEATALLDTVDFHHAVILTTTDEVPGPPDGQEPMRPARMVLYEPDRVKVMVETPAAGWLVLNDRAWPGWTATVDGIPARIYKANVMVRAVRVPAGKHEVEFCFRSFPLRAGGAVSLLGWLGMLGWWAMQGHKARTAGKRS